ncbi:hypothetical protein A2U01_0118818, partial [Trifolium medium]|nr:hypothetical protein [Trifolium medium]
VGSDVAAAAGDVATAASNASPISSTTGQAERQHREMMQVLQQRAEQPPPVQLQPNQGVQPQVPRGNP